MDKQQYTDQELLELIRKNNDNLKYVYKKTKKYSIRFMKKMSSGSKVTESDLNDIYHDAIMVLYEKIRDEKFKLTSSFQTYLNSVCRFQLLNKFKEKKKNTNLNDDFPVLNPEFGQYDPSVNDELEPVPDLNESKFNALDKAMNTLKDAGGKCYEILSLFWYQKKSMNYIADHLGYNNAATAKNQKAKCQKRLKKLAFKYL